MNANQISILLANDHCEVNIFHFTYQSGDKSWSAKIIKKEDGIDLQIEHYAADLESAVVGAYERYQRVCAKGIPEFAGPLLEAPKSDFHREINDEIPF